VILQRYWKAELGEEHLHPEIFKMSSGFVQIFLTDTVNTLQN